MVCGSPGDRLIQEVKWGASPPFCVIEKGQPDGSDHPPVDGLRFQIDLDGLFQSSHFTGLRPKIPIIACPRKAIPVFSETVFPLRIAGFVSMGGIAGDYCWIVWEDLCQGIGGGTN